MEGRTTTIIKARRIDFIICTAWLEVQSKVIYAFAYTSSVAPCTERALSEHRYMVASAMSSGVTQLAACASPIASRFAAVSIVEAAIRFTWIPADLTSADSDCVNAPSAALDAAYAESRALGFFAARELNPTIHPPLRARSAGRTAL